jgi:hypothetical protein
MSFFTARNKKILAGISMLGALSALSIELHATNPVTPAGPSQADLLAQIATYTNGTLTAVTSTTNPVVTALVAALTNLTAPDNSTNPPSPTPALQQAFTAYVTQTQASATAQTALQQQLQSTFFANLTPGTVGYANDLSFASLMGVATPVFNPDPRATPPADPALNYLQFASALNVTHTPPGNSWTGTGPDQAIYKNFFDTTYAAQSLNGYVLSQLYEDTKNGIPAAQTALINQAGTASWIATVASESIGAVLRQTLMYQSQSYILLTQILQTQKMLLATQAANNSLSVLQNMAAEGILRSRAVKRQPGL